LKGLCHLCLKTNQELLIDKMKIYCERCMTLVHILPKDVEDPPGYETRLPFQDLPTPSADELQLAADRLEKEHLRVHNQFLKEHKM